LTVIGFVASVRNGADTGALVALKPDSRIGCFLNDIRKEYTGCLRKLRIPRGSA
jgi:hypothetical protein